MKMKLKGTQLNAKSRDALVCAFTPDELIGCVIVLRPKRFENFRAYTKEHKPSEKVQNQSPNIPIWIS